MKTDLNPPALLEAIKSATPVSIDPIIVPMVPEPEPPVSSKKSNFLWLIIGLGLIGGCAVLFNQIHQQQKPE